MTQYAVFVFDCYVSDKRTVCFVFYCCISDRRKLYFVFDGLFSVKRMLFFPLIVTLVISARSILCFKGDSWRYFYSKYR